MNGRAINVPFDLRRGTRNSAKYYQQFYGAFLHDGLPYDAMSFARFNLSFWHVLPSPFSHCVSIRLGGLRRNVTKTVLAVASKMVKPKQQILQ